MNRKETFFSVLEKVVILLLILCVSSFVIGYRYYVIMSGSMLPTIKVGSICVIDTNEEKYKVGDVITYVVNGEVITHRINNIKGKEIYTKGDAIEIVDHHPILQQNIIGKCIFTIPLLGYLYIFLQNYFWYVLFFACFVCFIIIFLKKEI